MFEVLVVAWVYGQTLLMYPDAQEGLIFLFLPLLQAVFNLAAGVLLYWLQYRRVAKGILDAAGCA